MLYFRAELNGMSIGGCVELKANLRDVVKLADELHDMDYTAVIIEDDAGTELHRDPVQIELPSLAFLGDLIALELDLSPDQEQEFKTALLGPAF